MNTARIALGMALTASFCLPIATRASLSAHDQLHSQGTTNLTVSRVTTQLGAQWMDVEEEAEIQVSVDGYTNSSKWIVEGTFNVPKGTSMTGCMLWNDDTLLMGKLRGKSQANAIFDSLVPPLQMNWAHDPLLVEQLDDTTYGLHLYPFSLGGSRRFRLRYLVPLSAGKRSMSVKPLMAKAVDGAIPKQFKLKVKGSVTGAKLIQPSLSWPLDLPSNDLIELSANLDVSIQWPSAPTNDATRSVRAHIDSGAWMGDFVMYTDRIPDSIASRVTLKSETVILWKWIQPSSFLKSCWSYNSGDYTCLGENGNLAIQQAVKIRDIASNLVGSGNRVGLVADRSLSDSAISFTLADSGSNEYKRMDRWLGGINESYLMTNIPYAKAGTGAFPPNIDISKSRQSFKVDILDAGTLFSKDSDIVRHLLVVTVGPTSNSAYLEPFDTTLIPKNVSIASSRLVGSSHFDNLTSQYVEAPPPPADWSGVDLAGLVVARKGGNAIRPWNGIALPRNRDSLAGRLSIQSGSGKISRNLVVRRAPDGSMVASLNVHGIDVAKSVTWSLFDENGNTLKSWDANPEWLIADGDSVVPRLWAKSDAPMSPIFQDKELAPLFGIVDPFYSLLATPSDSVGKERQASLRDSGVPFLSSREIFARQGYGGENTGIADRASVSNSGLKVVFDASARTIRIDLEGLSARSVEVRDLRGTLLASWNKEQLSGLKSVSWRIPSNRTKGMLLVCARTATGILSSKFFAN